MAERHANKTANVRIYSRWEQRGNGILTVPDDITKKSPCIIALLQAQIDKGLLCNKQQYLLLYNFQVIDGSYYTLDMLIRPIANIDVLDKLDSGVILSLFINGNTGEVMNSEKAEVEILKMTDSKMDEEDSVLMQQEADKEEDVQTQENEKHISYGKYTDQEYQEKQSSDLLTTLSRVQTEFSKEVPLPDEPSPKSGTLLHAYGSQGSHSPKSPTEPISGYETAASFDVLPPMLRSALVTV